MNSLRSQKKSERSSPNFTKCLFCIRNKSAVKRAFCHGHVIGVDLRKIAFFILPPIIQNIDLAQFKPHKYIKCTLSRVDKNAHRIKGYVYQIHEWLDTLSLEERRRFWRDAKESYDSNKRYNSFRDEVEEFRSAAENNRNNPLTWRQSEFTDFDMQLFA